MDRSLKSTLKAACIALTLVFAASGCSGKTVNENDPASVLEDAESDIQADHYSVALEKLRMIKTKFPYSSVAVTATLRIADVYFVQESYAEAAAAYELFRDLYPKHEKSAYASFKIAQSYFKETPTQVARDLSSGYRAREAFESFLKRYPGDENADQARTDLKELLNLLASKELYVGRFYQKIKYYYSARPRFQKAISLYPGTPAAQEAAERLKSIGEEAAPGELPNPEQPIPLW